MSPSGFAFPKTPPIFAIPNGSNATRGISSAGSEHLPYKQRVTGSNPVFPTLKISHLAPKLSGCFNFNARIWAYKYIRYLSFTLWEVSSVGLERCFHTAEVEGSNPLLPTFIISHLASSLGGCFGFRTLPMPVGLRGHPAILHTWPQRWLGLIVG